MRRKDEQASVNISKQSEERENSTDLFNDNLL